MRVLAAPFFAINLGDANPALVRRHSLRILIINGLHAIGAAGSPPPAVLRSGAGGGDLGRTLPARLCGQTSTTGRTRRLRGGYELIAALIAVVCVEALTTVDTKLSATLVSIAGSL